MRILLYASITTESVRQDAETLAVRGYDVLTIGDVLEAMGDSSPRELMRTVFRCVAGMGEDRERFIVVHPATDPGAVMDLVGFCRTVDVMVVRMGDLPGVAPESESALNEYDMRVGRFVMPTLEVTKARTLGDRLRAAYRWLLHWEALVNAVLGDALKNPVSRELRKQPMRYQENTTITTTG